MSADGGGQAQLTAGLTAALVSIGAADPTSPGSRGSYGAATPEASHTCPGTLGLSAASLTEGRSITCPVTVPNHLCQITCAVVPSVPVLLSSSSSSSSSSSPPAPAPSRHSGRPRVSVLLPPHDRPDHPVAGLESLADRVMPMVMPARPRPINSAARSRRRRLALAALAERNGLDRWRRYDVGFAACFHCLRDEDTAFALCFHCLRDRNPALVPHGPPQARPSSPRRSDCAAARPVRGI